LIRCLRGSVFDVIVDVREKSATFGCWHAVELTEVNQRQVLIPPGCAHGFQTLLDDCQLLYQHSAAYAPYCEDGLAYDDAQVGIAWPLPITEMSARDRAFKRIGSGFEGVRI
jgi:dTDP-4-dehydrorhamnose 3,5-epimerase